MRRLVAAAVTALLAPLTATLVTTPAADAFVGDPVGANDWSCTPSARKPTPVVLVHGTFGDRRSLLDRMSATLKKAGYCVYSLDYGNRATGPVEESAAELDVFVDRVLGATGAAQVSLVGHSQGGMMPRYWIKNLGGAALVDDLVGIAPSNHGTFDSQALAPMTAFCYSCTQQASDSEFLAELNAGDESPGEVSYTNIVTRHDQVVVPYTSGYLAPADNVTNVTLQDTCTTDLAEHLHVIQDGPAIRWTLNALATDGPADPAYRPSCLP